MATEMAAATARAVGADGGGHPGPELPLPVRTSASPGAATGAATALLLLLLVLLAKGFAALPPSLARMLSLRRLLPSSYPFLLELERPD